jgi:hypothetical protein
MTQDPQLEFLYAIDVHLEEGLQIGDTKRGARLIVPLKGGSFEGPRLKGTLIPGGADWLLVRSDGVGELDVRGTLRTDDGALLYYQLRGYLTNFLPTIASRWPEWEGIPRDQYSFTVTPYYETSAPQYAWLAQTVCLGLGTLIRGGVSYRIFAVR